MTAAMPYPKTQFCMTGINETVATAIGGFSRTTGQVVEKKVIQTPIAHIN